MHMYILHNIFCILIQASDALLQYWFLLYIWKYIFRIDSKVEHNDGSRSLSDCDIEVDNQNCTIETTFSHSISQQQLIDFGAE